MPKRAPYFHVYLGLMVMFASYAMGATMRVREARLNGKPLNGCTRRLEPISTPDTLLPAHPAAKYRDGVCLIIASYAYFDPRHRPLRYLDHSLDGASPLSGTGKSNLDFDGTGDVYLKEVVSTGLFTGNGEILSTADVAHPWGEKNEYVDDLVGSPEVQEIRAYFPKYRSPFKVKVDRCSLKHDVSHLVLESGDIAVPVPAFAEIESGLPPFDFRKTHGGNGPSALAMGFLSGNNGVLVRLPEGPVKQEANWRSRFSEKASILTANGVLRPEIDAGTLAAFRGRVLLTEIPSNTQRGERFVFNQDGALIGLTVKNNGTQTKESFNSDVTLIPIRSALAELESTSK